MTYKVQIDDVLRDATLDEVEKIELVKTQEKAESAANKAKADARSAVLAKLGLSAEEAAALLG